MKKQFWAGLLALCCLTGCGARPVSLPAEPEAAGNTLAYVPLDDRPVNVDRVADLAESLGYRLLLPERALFHTALDGQPQNENGTSYGDRSALFQWVAEQEEAGCDRYILSLDQLLSGGLVNSRSFAGAPITLADGAAHTEMECVDWLLETLGTDGENQIYLLDTVMRLAPTVGYEGWDLEGYQALRSYGMEARPTLSGAELNEEAIAAAYGLGADGQSLRPEDFGVTAAEAERYHRSRSRKLNLTCHALRAAEGMDNVQFLIGVDDSAPSASIQTSEIALLKQLVEGRGAVLSGADEDGMLAVCHLFGKLDAHTALPTVGVRYFGGTEHRASSDFDHQPMTEIVEAHLGYLGTDSVEPEQADLQLLVLTAPAEGDGQAVIDALVQALEENRKAGVPTVLMDAAKNAYGDRFQKALVEKTQLGILLGYGGFYDLANVTGVSLANGVARWLYLAGEHPVTERQLHAFQRTLADSLLKDLCYKNHVKPQLITFVKEEFSGSSDNFYAPEIPEEQVLAKLEKEMEKATGRVLKSLRRSNLIISLTPYEELGWGKVQLAGYRFPWARVFEICIDIQLSPLTAPH